MKRVRLSLLTLAISVDLFSISMGVSQQEPFTPSLEGLAHGIGWTIENRNISLMKDGGIQFVRFDEGPGVGLAWIDSSSFVRGVIELDVRGKNVAQRSFPGVAFHGIDDSTYECVYFRPFNFRSADSLARSHSVQYISPPASTWRKLRTDHPGIYEKSIQPSPDPEGWFHARIVVSAGEVSVFVNDSQIPSLVVQRLAGREYGKIGLWVGDNSGGDFAHFRVLSGR